MKITEDDFRMMNEAIQYYVLKFVKVGNLGFFDEFDISDFNIERLSDNSFQFSYSFNGNSGYSDTRLLTGFISKDYVSLKASKTVSSLTCDEEINRISFITVKEGEYVPTSDGIEYFDIYSTTKKVELSSGKCHEVTESIEHTQMYEFNDDNINLASNFRGLSAKKWSRIGKVRSLDLIR